MGCAVEVEDDPFEVEVSKEMGLPAPPPLDVFLIVCGGGKTVQLKVDPHMDDGFAGVRNAVVRERRKSAVIGAEASLMSLGSSKQSIVRKELLRHSRADVFLQTGPGLGGWVAALVESQLKSSDSRSSVVMCGWQNVRDDFSPWQRQYCILDGTNVLFFESANASDPCKSISITDTPVGRYSASLGASTEEEFDPDRTLYIATPDTTVFLTSETTVECSRWLRCLFRNQVAEGRQREGDHPVQ